MKDHTTKDKFVELRAQGKSFASIAEVLGVSKPTLIEWSREMQVLIANLRAVSDEALCERYRLTKERQLQVLSCQFEAIETEIGKRDLKEVPIDKLYAILFKLTEGIRDQNKPTTFQRTGINLDDLESTTQWEA